MRRPSVITSAWLCLVLLGCLGGGTGVYAIEVQDIAVVELEDATASVREIVVEKDVISEFLQTAQTAASGNATDFVMIPPDPVAPPILTPTLKEQKITKLRLRNGMGVYIVSDPGLEKSSMAVGVNVGSWSDPDEALGMAHFVEHMMFMGTKQHPKPGGFDDFLASHGAQISNAATGGQSTCYAFAVPHGAFEEGIERFSEFFTDPLFDSKGAAKEMHAVNQEFEMHKDQDGYRQYMVSNQLANPTHPKSRFTIGNLDTLSKVENKALVDWYTKHYSSNLMTVAVYTAHNASTVMPLIVEGLKGVPNREYHKQMVQVPVLRADLVKKVVHVKPLKDSRSVELQWEMPSKFAHTRLTRPDRLISRILGDEGKGSLAYRLREQHLALSVSVGMGNEGNNNALFAIQLSLTEKGMALRDQVIALVFKSIAEATKNGVKKYFFKEGLQQDLNSWKFQGRTADVFDAAMGAVGSMMKEPLETYPRTLYIAQQYDRKGAMEILKMLTPGTVYINQMGGKFPPEHLEGPVQTEKFYKAKFAIATIPTATMKLWETMATGGEDADIDQLWGASEFKLPPRNPYIPRHLKAGTVDSAAPKFPDLPHPELIKEDEFGKLYLGTDRVFGDPYISISILVRTPAAITEKYGPKAKILAELMLTCIEHSIKAATYPFSMASLSGGLGLGKGTNFYIDISGKVPKAEAYFALLKLLLDPLKRPLSSHTSKTTFEMIRKALVRSYANSLKSGPASSASRTLWTAFSNTNTPVEQLLKAAEEVEYQHVEEFVPELLKEFNLEAFLYGQINKKQATKLYQMAKESLQMQPGGESHAPTVEEVTKSAKEDDGAGKSLRKNSTALPTAKEFIDMFRVLPDGQGPWYMKANGIARGNATLLLVDGGHLPCDESLAFQVFYKEVGNMFFKELRTKQQTGYVAQSYTTLVARRTVAMFLVESSWAGPGDLLGRFEAFQKLVLDGLHNGTMCSHKQLEMVRQSMLSSYKKPIQNIQEMSGVLQSIVKEKDSDFDSPKKTKYLLEQLTREKIVRVANKVLSPANTRRVAVLYTAQGVEADAVPKHYQPFTATIGKLQKKPQYKCEVCFTCPVAPPPASPGNSATGDATNQTSTSGMNETVSMANDVTGQLSLDAAELFV